MTARELSTHDGIVISALGDLVLVHYGSDARLHRTRWLFDEVDRYTKRHGAVIAMMVVPAHAATPDAHTRNENRVRIKQLTSIRRLVTVAEGDAFKVSIVRTIMRAIVLIQGRGKEHFVVDTEAEGIERLLQVKSATTPPQATIETMLSEIRAISERAG